MNKKLLSIMTGLGVFALILSGCNNQKEPEKQDPTPSEGEGGNEPEPEIKTSYDYNFKASLFYDDNGNQLELNYELPLAYLSFEQPATTFNKELAVISLAFSINAYDKTVVNEMYTAFGFDNITNSPDFDVAETKESVKYTFAHKKVGDVDVIALTSQGVEYKLPWASNACVGESGNHAGFQAGADKVSQALSTYLAKYPSENRKIWVTGYSRAAAIFDIVSYNLIDEEVIAEDNLYAYLFETPKGVEITNENEYKSIFNIFNSRDLVTHVAPEEYNLQRVGVEIDIYDENADAIISAFNEKLVLNTFTPNEDSYADEVELINYILSKLTTPYENDDPENEVHDLSTRENYYTYYQSKIEYLVGLFFSLKPETMTAAKAAFDKLGMFDKLGLIAPDGLYNFIKPVLDAQEETYDDEQLRSSLNQLLDLLKVAPEVLAVALSEEARTSLLRTVQFHAPEAVFPLLLAYGVETEVEAE